MPVPDLTPQDDLLIAVSLCRFSVQFEDAEPRLAEHAWNLAAAIIDQHDLEPADVVFQLETLDSSLDSTIEDGDWSEIVDHDPPP